MYVEEDSRLYVGVEGMDAGTRGCLTGKCFTSVQKSGTLTLSQLDNDTQAFGTSRHARSTCTPLLCFDSSDHHSDI